MWSTTVVLSILLFYGQVLGGEIQDITTIYEIGHGRTTVADDSTSLKHKPFIWDNDRDSPDNIMPDLPEPERHCINGVTGRIHVRTNALGMGIINEKIKYIDSNSSRVNNITCAVSFDGEPCPEWDFGSETKRKLVTYSSGGTTGIIVPNGKAKKIIENQLFLKIKNISNPTYIFFTKMPGSLENENDFPVIKLSGSTMTWYVLCGTRHRSYLIETVDRNGSYLSVYCNDYNNYNIQLEDYLSFYFDRTSNGLSFRVFRGYGGEKTNVINDHYSRHHYGGFPIINYFSISTTSATAVDLAEDEIVSPYFTPQSSNLCLAIIFHSSMPSIVTSSELVISALELLSNDRYQYLQSISNFESGWNTRLVNVSLLNLNPIKISVKKRGGTEIGVARIATCNPEGEEVTELSLPISVCPSDTRIHPWTTGKSLQIYTTAADVIDPAEELRNTTNYCWNGGVLTSAGCACTPGFSGPKCEIGCGRNRFGQDCEGLCSFYSEECRGLLLCTRYTGCRCAPGFHGEDCTQACTPGWYGNDCSETCGHCAGNSPCDVYTGECSACEEGYLAPHCKIASVYYGAMPELTSPSYGILTVSFDPNNYISQGETPQMYQIQFREKGQQWKIHTSKSLQKSSDESEKEKKVSEKIEGLKSGVLYQVRVLLVDAYFQKYDGDLVQVAELLTKCDIPTSYDYKVTAISNTTSIQFSWRYVTEDQSWCPLEIFEVNWKEGWKSRNMVTTDNSFVLSGLVPGLPIKLKVRAKTSRGFAPFSKLMRISAQQTELPPVKSLLVDSSQSTSVEVSWQPPRGSGDKQLQYTISYTCVDRPACSQGCQNVTEGQLTQEGTSITLSPLLPFTKYLVTVSAEGGAQSSIFVGTTKVVPTEVPVVSAQTPVRTNTSLTVFWDQVPVCTGYLLGYNYQLTKASENLKILASGFTKETNASFHNLTASTEYVVRVFISTVAGWNPLSYLTINVNTSATVPDAVRNLTVYKRGRGMLGLRWAEPRATYGQLKSFTVTHSLGQEVVSHTVEPSRCVVWPELYCHTIEGLRSNRRYNVSVSARNSEVAEDGEISFVSAVTKESPPSAPVSLKVVDSSSTSIKLEWDYPDMANGIVRSFLISVEETEKYDQDSCCQIYPFVETSVKEESQTYSAEVSGLHPASTYFVTVSAKTVGLGPSQSLVVSTRPPHLPLTSLPRVQEPEVSWQPQDKLPEVNNSDIYSSLVRVNLLLAVLNENETTLVASESRITDPKLDSLLQQRIGKPFYFIAEYNQDDDVEISGPLEDNDSPWGRPPASLSPREVYWLVATQVLEYNGVYNVDLRYSQPFTLTD